MDRAQLEAVARELRESGQLGDLLALLAERAPLVFRRTEGPRGNVYVRPMFFAKAGDRVEGHCHNYDHMTSIDTGAVLARSWSEEWSDGPPGEDGVATRVCRRVDIREETYRAQSEITIPAKRVHEFTALVDGTSARCIFAHRDYQGEVVPVYQGIVAATL